MLKTLIVLATLSGVVVASTAAAQRSDAHEDGNSARTDAMFGTYDRYTLVPQDNIFATTPGLEQQARRSTFTFNVLAPIFYNSNADLTPSGGTAGQNSAEFSPIVGLSWSTPVFDLPLRFTAGVRAEVDRFTQVPSADFDKVALSGRLQYVDPTNDQAYSPYFVYAPRFDFDPFFRERFATRQDLNLGVNKTFNFDANFRARAVLARYAGRDGLVVRHDGLRPTAIPRPAALVVGLLRDPVDDLRHLRELERQPRHRGHAPLVRSLPGIQRGRVVHRADRHARVRAAGRRGSAPTETPGCSAGRRSTFRWPTSRTCRTFRPSATAPGTSARRSSSAGASDGPDLHHGAAVGRHREGSMAPESTQKLSLFALTMMVVGGMVGAGIFSLPRTFAGATGPIGAVIAWLIAGTGMYMLARVFQSLAERKPDLDAGVFAYAKAGFGDYPGFLSAFGYWIGSCIGNVSYWVLIKSTLGAFFPVFGDGNTVVAIVVASVGIWLFHFMILRGTQQAAVINSIVTVAKIVPILVFIVLLIFAFKLDLFSSNLYGGDLTTGVFEQVRATMLVTVFVFLGIEGASVYSRFAKERSDVGRATILGFVIVTTLMVLVTLLPYAVLQRADIAGMRQPSMATVLEAVVGHWGAVFVSIGLLVSVLGAYLAWSLICAEVLFTAAKTKDMPKAFATENKNKVPVDGAVGDQHRRAADRHHDLLVARRLRADAQPDQRDGADSLPVRGRVRAEAHAARRDLRRAAAGAAARPHHRRASPRSTRSSCSMPAA